MPPCQLCESCQSAAEVLETCRSLGQEGHAMQLQLVLMQPALPDTVVCMLACSSTLSLSGKKLTSDARVLTGILAIVHVKLLLRDLGGILTCVSESGALWHSGGLRHNQRRKYLVLVSSAVGPLLSSARLSGDLSTPPRRISLMRRTDQFSVLCIPTRCVLLRPCVPRGCV